MSKQGTIPPKSNAPPPIDGAAEYVAPRLSTKRSLELVTLQSFRTGTGGRVSPDGPGYIGTP
jgi:hypothetical protein